MRILQLSPWIYPFRSGGIEIYTYNLSESLRDRGHDVFIVASEKSQEKIDANKNPRLSLLPVFRKKYASPSPVHQEQLCRRVKSIVDNFQPELIHVQHLFEVGEQLLEQLEKWGIPYVLSIHDFFYLCPKFKRVCKGNYFICAKECCRPYPGRGYWFRLCKDWLTVTLRKQRYMKYFNRASGPILSNSRSAAKIYINAGLRKDRVIVHPLGVRLQDSQQSTSRPLASEPRYGFIGNILPEKGVLILLEAFKKLKIRRELHLWGGAFEQSHPILKEIEVLSAQMPLYYHGAYDHRKIEQVFQSFDICIVPSIWEETYGLVIQEALAAKKILIVSEIGGMKERIISGVNGFLVPAGNVRALAEKMEEVALNFESIKNKLDFSKGQLSIEDDGLWHEEFYDWTVKNWGALKLRKKVPTDYA